MKNRTQSIRHAFVALALVMSMAMIGTHAMAEGRGTFEAGGITVKDGMTTGKVSGKGALYPKEVWASDPGKHEEPKLLSRRKYKIVGTGSSFKIVFDPPLEGDVEVIITGDAGNKGTQYLDIEGSGWD